MRQSHSRFLAESAPRRSVRAACCGAVIALSATGCQDGPMYGLKTINPFYVAQWKSDAEIGVTDHERRKDLAALADSVASMSAADQQRWGTKLAEIAEQDPNAEMRRLAVLAGGRLRDAAAAGRIMEIGLKDRTGKVRMQACRSLGSVGGEASARSLIAVIHSDTDLDVRHAALDALGNHRDPAAIAALRQSLEDSNPATRSLAIASLRQNTGQNHGSDPAAWIAALDGSGEASNPSNNIASVADPGLPAGSSPSTGSAEKLFGNASVATVSASDRETR